MYRTLLLAALMTCGCSGSTTIDNKPSASERAGVVTMKHWRDGKGYWITISDDNKKDEATVQIDSELYRNVFVGQRAYYEGTKLKGLSERK